MRSSDDFCKDEVDKWRWIKGADSQNASVALHSLVAGFKSTQRYIKVQQFIDELIEA